MNKGAVIVFIVAAIAGTLGAGYWLGSRGNTGTPAAQIAAASRAAQKEPKILFYRNPMGLPDTSQTPKKDQMGMDYIPVYEGEEEASPEARNQVRISAEKIQKLGVRTEAAAMRDLSRIVRAVGRIEARRTPDLYRGTQV